MSGDFHADETVIAPSGSESLLGKTIGNYTVTDVLGKGGFGEVYKAWDTKLDRYVALKFLRQTSEDFHAELFEREARALGALSKHPNILHIYTWDEYKGANFFVLEYMSRSVADEMKRYPGGMPIDMAARIIAQCADGLAYAHDRQILHRDIKAQNILLEERDGSAKIADFGLARICGPSDNTIEGQAIGSPVYMAPEQARGQKLTHLCDIYSLGVTLYELLCGKPSVSGSSILKVLEKVRNNDRVPLRTQKPGLPDAVYAIVDRATAPEPANRYQSAMDMAADLRMVTNLQIEAPILSATPAKTAKGDTLTPMTTSAATPIDEVSSAPTPAEGIERPKEVDLSPEPSAAEKSERKTMSSGQKVGLAVVLGGVGCMVIGLGVFAYVMIADGGPAPYMDNYYQDDGNSGYYDIYGNPISSSTVLFDGNDNYVGPQGGYYDSLGNLLGGGYYEVTGSDVAPEAATTLESVEELGGYYERDGNFVQGYLDEDGFWVSGPNPNDEDDSDIKGKY